MLENIWRKSVSLWAKCIYIYIVSPFVHIHTCMYTITTSIQYTYIMCSHPGVDKNIDVPLSDDRFFICIYIYIRMYRKHQNGQVFQKSIFYLLQDDCIWSIYIYIQHYPTMKASRLLRHLRHLRVWLLLCRLLLGFALGPKNEQVGLTPYMGLMGQKWGTYPPVMAGKSPTWSCWWDDPHELDNLPLPCFKICEFP